MQDQQSNKNEPAPLMAWLRANRGFMTLWGGQLVSSVGSRLSSFALGLWVLHTTGSTTQFAITYILMALPPVVLGTVAGTLADRHDRRRIMMLCDGLATALMLALAASLAWGHLAVWHVYLAVGITAVLDTFRMPAFLASVPLLVRTEDLARANGLAQTSEAASSIAGPLLAGVLVSTISSAGVIVVDALSFAVGVMTLALVTIPHPLPSGPDEHSDLFRDAAAGWRYVHERPGLLGLLTIYGFNHFIFAVASVLIAPLLLSITTPALLGLQYSLGGVGLLIGGIVLTAWGGPRRQIDGVLLFTGLGGVLLALHGIRPSFLLIAVCGFFMFMTLPVADASNTSLWQRKVPNHLLGRCVAIRQVLLNLATAIGFASAGPLADHLFEPLLHTDGALAGSVGALIGTGPGRGIGLIFVLLGTLMSLVSLRAWFIPAVRGLDDLEDYEQPLHRTQAEPA